MKKLLLIEDTNFLDLSEFPLALNFLRKSEKNIKNIGQQCI